MPRFGIGRLLGGRRAHDPSSRIRAAAAVPTASRCCSLPVGKFFIVTLSSVYAAVGINDWAQLFRDTWEGSARQGAQAFRAYMEHVALVLYERSLAARPAQPSTSV